MDPWALTALGARQEDGLKRAYRREALKWHPDKNQENREAQEKAWLEEFVDNDDEEYHKRKKKKKKCSKGEASSKVKRRAKVPGANLSKDEKEEVMEFLPMEL
eukprot:Skav229482  [mRNA]  locus=scaffold4918:40166:42404:+ [translate_table: standard]